MDRPRRLTFAAVALAAATLLAACGDDDDNTATTAATTTASTSGESTTSGSSGSSGEVGSKQDYIDGAKSAIDLDDEQMRGCVAEAVVSDDVYAAIQKTGMSVDDFKTGDSLGKLNVGETEAKSVASDIAACGELLPKIITDEDQLNCAQQSLSNEQYAQFLSFRLFGIDVPEDVQGAIDQAQKCATGSTATTGPSTTT